MTEIRRIGEDDVEAIIDLYRAVYGDAFPFQEFYDAQWIKKGVFNDDIVWLVGIHEGRLLGSSAVMLNAGDSDDLIGEVGRLVVHPDSRGLGLGAKLIGALDEAVSRQIEFAFAECRTAHVGAQKILTRLGYRVVGLEPLAYDIAGVRESVVFVCRHFGNARRLRRNNPRVIGDVYELASMALHNCEFEADAIVEHDVEPYPVRWDGAEIEGLEDTEVYRLLRLSRRNLQSPDVFSGMRLEHGFLKLKSADAEYLVLRRGTTITAGIGYVWDDIDRKIRITELVNVDDESAGTMLVGGLKKIEERFDPAVIHIDVSAYSPRAQKTLALLGFVPAAYCPSMVYVAGERLDVVKLQKLRVPPKFEHSHFIDATEGAAELVHDAVRAKSAGARIDDTIRRVRIFDGLSDLQVSKVAARAVELPYEVGERVFKEGAEDQALLIVLEGAITIVDDDNGQEIATVGAGDIVGEMALIDELPRSAGALCAQKARVLALRAVDFDTMCRKDPMLGFVVARNIARTISRRLRAGMA